MATFVPAKTEPEDRCAAMTEQEQILLELIEKTVSELSLIEEAQGREAALCNGSRIRLVERSERALARLRGEPFCQTIHVPHQPSTGCRLRYTATWGDNHRLEYPTDCFQPSRWAKEQDIIRFGDPLAIWAWIGFSDVVSFACTDIFPKPDGANDYTDRKSPLLGCLNTPSLGARYASFCCEIENSPLLHCFRGRNGTRVRHWQIKFDFYQVDVVARKMGFPKKLN